MKSFNLHILEYCNSENLILCGCYAKKWIDLVKPEYNINPIAGSTGYKHGPSDGDVYTQRKKISTLATGRKHTYEVRDLMSKNRKGINNPFYKKSIVLKL